MIQLHFNPLVDCCTPYWSLFRLSFFPSVLVSQWQDHLDWWLIFILFNSITLFFCFHKTMKISLHINFTFRPFLLLSADTWLQSISPTFNQQIFWSLKFRIILFWRKNIGEKAALEMLEKFFQFYQHSMGCFCASRCMLI